MTSPTTTATAKRTTRLLVRFAASGALALSLAGGVSATVASAAPAPVDDGRLEVAPSGPIGEVVLVDPGPTVPTIPEPPDPGPGRPDPLKPCKDLPDHLHVPKECRPDPCKEKAEDAGKGYERPDRCRPDPCKDKGEPGKPEEPEGDSPELRRHPEPKECPPPPPKKKCEDPDGCDRPVPGKPTFTG